VCKRSRHNKIWEHKTKVEVTALECPTATTDLIVSTTYQFTYKQLLSHYSK